MKNNRTTRQNLFATSLSVVAAMYAAPSSAVTVADPVILTFSTVGDSRQDPQNIDSSIKQNAMVNVGKCPVPSGTTGLTANPGLSGQDCKWLQNTTAWSRIMRTIQSQKANLLFFNGDMIMGYGKADVPVASRTNGTSTEVAIANPTVSQIVTSDLMQFYQQYGFWRGMVANLMETGTYVVPVPGNHEVECKRCTGIVNGVSITKTAQQVNENAWKDNMGDLILDQTRLNNILASTGLSLNANTWNVANAPTATSDGLSTDQTQLSYSFDIGTSHFAVINTDPVGNDGHAPNNWLDADLNYAVSHTGAKQLFVFGHKPAFFYNYTGSAPSSTSSLILADSVAGNAFWNIIAKYHATYFTGHEHIYHVESHQSNDGLNNSAYQVLVGAGGSPFEDSAKSGTSPTDRLYSWATVSIYQSGKAVINTYGFDDTLVNPIKKLETITIPAVQ